MIKGECSHRDRNTASKANSQPTLVVFYLKTCLTMSSLIVIDGYPSGITLNIMSKAQFQNDFVQTVPKLLHTFKFT